MRAISCNKLNYFFYYCKRMGIDIDTPKLRFYAVDRFYYRLYIHIVNKYRFYEDD
jgi:hypothetical protein